MSSAIARAEKNLAVFGARLKSVIRSALIFVVITQALAALREWFADVIKTNDDATAAIARLKAALLTLAQPLVDVIIPAFATFVNILADVVTEIAKIFSLIFGSTLDQSKESAEALYNEKEALDGAGAAAKKASKSFASFDEINKLSGDSGGGGASSDSGTPPNFNEIGDGDWLKDRLGEAAGMISAALILGGIALVALGAAVGSIKAVIAGLLLIGTGVYIAEETGSMKNWADTPWAK